MSNSLSNNSLAALRTRGVQIPGYDRSRLSSGVVHFGPGAFHRAHQAYYFDALLNSDQRWGICEVALQSTTVRDALAVQDGLYTLCILDSGIRYQVIGSAREFLVARESNAAVLDRMAAPTTLIVTATITEKGYCLSPAGSLDFNHADIRHDLSAPQGPLTFVGYLVEGLRRRRDERIGGLNVVSCDNLTDNGNRLRRATLDFACERDRSLATWIEQEVAFPRTMVDSITPATDDELRARVAHDIGIADRWPVQREAFTQWVIENTLRGAQPDFERIGVTLTKDVDGFEKAKLRFLNGAHSTLAYVGLLAGFETVSAAMSDPTIVGLIETLMSEIKPSVVPPIGFDVDRYVSSLLDRFRNSTLKHRLAQIAWDGSQKIPYRLLGTIRDNLQADRSIDSLCIPVAAWFHFLRRRAQRGEPPVDPMATPLCAVASACSGAAREDVDRFLGLWQVFPADLANTARFRDTLVATYSRLDSLHTSADLRRTLVGAQ